MFEKLSACINDCRCVQCVMCFSRAGGGGGGEHSHMKGAGMLVVSLRNLNFGFGLT